MDKAQIRDFVFASWTVTSLVTLTYFYISTYPLMIVALELDDLNIYKICVLYGIFIPRFYRYIVYNCFLYNSDATANLSIKVLN